MRRYLCIGFLVTRALLWSLTTSMAAGGEMEGKVQAIDSTERTITFDNGTKVWLGDAVQLQTLTEGAEIRLSYEDRDGKPVATQVDVK